MILRLCRFLSPALLLYGATVDPADLLLQVIIEWDTCKGATFVGNGYAIYHAIRALGACIDLRDLVDSDHLTTEEALHGRGDDRSYGEDRHAASNFCFL